MRELSHCPPIQLDLDEVEACVTYRGVQISIVSPDDSLGGVVTSYEQPLLTTIPEKMPGELDHISVVKRACRGFSVGVIRRPNNRDLCR